MHPLTCTSLQRHPQRHMPYMGIAVSLLLFQPACLLSIISPVADHVPGERLLPPPAAHVKMFCVKKKKNLCRLSSDVLNTCDWCWGLKNCSL